MTAIRSGEAVTFWFEPIAKGDACSAVSVAPEAFEVRVNGELLDQPTIQAVDDRRRQLTLAGALVGAAGVLVVTITAPQARPMVFGFEVYNPRG